MKTFSPLHPKLIYGAALFFLYSLTGCSTLPSGQSATLTPGWHRIQHAAWNAASSPHVWAPVGTALLLQIDHADERISDWAIENTPLFGSNEKASNASDYLLTSSFICFGATALATPSGGEDGKLQGLGIQTTAPLLTLGTTELLKTISNRARPNGEDHKSFPSGHTSVTAANSMLAYKNTEHLQISGWSKTALKTGFVVLPYATGWARVEGGNHYPSDILIGAALGNFFGAFINDAFLGAESPNDLQLILDIQPHEAFTIGLNRRF